MTRWKLILEWDGAPFMGWQRQDHGPSVQGALEEAARKMTGETVTATYLPEVAPEQGMRLVSPGHALLQRR